MSRNDTIYAPTPKISPDDLRQITVGQVIFNEDLLLQLARTTGFAKRAPRKIGVCALLDILFELCPHGSPSYNDLAARIESSQGQSPSRQAVALRFNGALESFLKALLEKVIAQRITGGDTSCEATSERFGEFRRVLVQDSTIIKLPAALFARFSGVSNASSTVCNSRIQAIYDLVDMRFLDFSIDPYSKNDQTAAPELSLQQGDLVLRDRGYLLLDEIQRHLDAGADCIYRHKTGTTYLDPQTLLPIDLPALLRKHGRLDIDVLLNNDSRTPVRLVAAPVNEETANLRRMKARKETRGHNPSQAVLELMDWTIFITTIPADRADFQRVFALYGLRWRIEIIFKAWKSHMKFHVLHRVSERQLAILLKARLLLIACCANILYGTLELLARRKYQRRLSLLKFMNYLSSSPTHLMRAFRSLSAGDAELRDFLRAIARYCCYDTRKRRNYSEIWEGLA